MKTHIVASFILFMVIPLLNAEMRTYHYIAPGWKGPGALILASTSNATDILDFSFGFEEHSFQRKAIWEFRRLKRGEISTQMGAIHVMSGGLNWYNCSLTPTEPDTNKTMLIRIDFDRLLKNGERKEGTEKIVIPTSGTASGTIGIIYYQATWTSNNATHAIDAGASQHGG